VLGEQLAREGQIPTYLVDQLSEELQVPYRLEALQKLLTDRSAKQILRLHMLSSYRVQPEDEVLENRAAELTYEDLKKASEKSLGTSPKPSSKQNIMANLVVSSLEALEVTVNLFRPSSRRPAAFYL